ncbi:tyrosine--tRNA ligase [Paenibacillus sp. CAA11]|uniref:tyrosine--tRNA ligase n=1 Tax=Paenibacillus sp. CAA11 TaxID=1532905 RepID=UPI000D36BC33|nr:tyrosine--tRNA ligase [Paenibacillus sp. CAA11]AWB45192.1 tyrosine--tRNA ligase [Paenibacillus sp. CAA11]
MDGKELTHAQAEEVKRQLKCLARGVVEIVPEEALERKVMKSVISGVPLKVKLGLDPSAPDIHIGHTVVMQKLRQFQELGHQVQLIIGDFTGRIGDPTGKSETRKELTEEDVLRNAETYRQQIFKILDPEKTQVLFNSEWLSPMTFSDVVKLAAKVTVARMLERDDFTKRYQSGAPISIHEFFYPLMQGMDSVVLQSDVELGGTDQKFNLLMGRTLQKEYALEPQVVMMTPLLKGLDGVKKMSKSLGNYIGIDEAPNEIYGKAMSIPDEQMTKYFMLVTDLSNEELTLLEEGLETGTLHPRNVKMKLAYTLVRMYHGLNAAEAAQEHFITVFQQRSLPVEVEEKNIHFSELESGRIHPIKLLALLGFASSNSEARRSIQQGAMKLNEKKVEDYNTAITVSNGDIVQVGKRKFAKLRIV